VCALYVFVATTNHMVIMQVVKTLIVNNVD
jgi:hypothetical protein